MFSMPCVRNLVARKNRTAQKPCRSYPNLRRHQTAMSAPPALEIDLGLEVEELLVIPAAGRSGELAGEK